MVTVEATLEVEEVAVSRGGMESSAWKFHFLRRICTKLYVWKFTERGKSISLRRTRAQILEPKGIPILVYFA